MANISLRRTNFQMKNQGGATQHRRPSRHQVTAKRQWKKKFEGYNKECDGNIRIEVIQKTTLLGSARILRNVLSM